MKGYVVCVYKNISSEEKLKEYAVKARTAVETYKGKFLISGGKATTNEGDSSPRTVVIEFPNKDKALGWYNSDEHQKIVVQRRKATDPKSTIVICEESDSY